MRQNKLLLLLVLLMTAATGAWAQTETLLTTITATGKDSYSETTSGVVTVSHDNTDFDGSSGWLWATQEGSVTVEAKDGYTITKCVFIKNGNPFATISSSPFKVNFILSDETETYYCEGTDVMDGFNCVTSIEVYGPAPAPTGYSITLDEGTGNKDSQNWEIKPMSSELSGGEAVTVKYNGSREVKSVTVVKKGAVDNTYLRWNGKQKKLVEEEIPAGAFVVTSKDGDYQCSEGTYVVEGNVEIKGTITLIDGINLIIKDGAKLTANKIIGNSQKLYIYGQAKMTGELVINGSVGDAIRELSTLEVHSAKVTATTSTNASCGIGEISTFNVYGGSVEAKGTVASGCGIGLTMGSSMNIYGGEVKAEGTGDGDVWGYGITCEESPHPATVKVYGGKLWAGNANNKALYNYVVNLKKGDGFNDKIETSADNSDWAEYNGTTTPTTKYVRVGY